MTACAIANYESAQKELTATIAQLDGRLDPIGRRRFHLSQTAWIRFRDANVDFLADSARGGTLAPLLRESALAQMTLARTKELKQASTALASPGK